jgi:hypothetical protein
MSDYYIAYEENVAWNGSVFNANEYRRAINSFYSKVDLVKPNAIVEDDAPIPSFSIKNLSPDANFPNELGFNLSGKFSTSKRDELTGQYTSYVTLSGDVKVPRQTSSGKTLKVIIASDFKSTRGYGKTPGEAFNNAFKQLRESLLQTLADQVGGSGRGIKVERQDPFTDPDPALVGPPTQTISGIANKAPVVDNPNIKLPSQEVKSLDPNVAQQAASKAQDAASSATSQVKSAASSVTSQVQGAASDVTSQAQGAASSVTSQVQGAASGVTNQAQGAVSGVTSQAKSASSALNGLTGGLLGGAAGAGIGALVGGGKGALIGGLSGATLGGVVGSLKSKADGLGKDWNPDKFNPTSIAGNDKVIDPRTGQITSTQAIAKVDAAKKALGAGLLGGAAGAGIGALAGGGKGALIGGLGGAAVGTGLSLGGITGGALAGTGLGAGIGALAGGGKGAIIGGVAGGALGAAAAKLSSIRSGIPKPKIPKPPSQPRIKTVKIKKPKDYTGDINVPSSSDFQKEAMSLPNVGTEQISNINQNLSGLV